MKRAAWTILLGVSFLFSGAVAGDENPIAAAETTSRRPAAVGATVAKPVPGGPPVTGEIEYANFTFKIAPPWSCKAEETELICSKVKAQENLPEVMIIAAMANSPTDSLEKFEEKLRKSKLIRLRGSTPARSEIKSVKRTEIGGVKWVDATHFQSEIPGYFTRYVATVHGPNSVVVTFSAKKDLFEKFNIEAKRILETIRFKPLQ